MRYWLQLDEADQESFDAAAEQVSCCDEKTGIQALERASPTRTPIPGSVERQDAHYIRHGTRTLIANFEVATGYILLPTAGLTRNEQDFADHVTHTVALDPNAEWIFIIDNLNTHISASLVRLVADSCDLDLDLGTKDRSGILRSMTTQMDFLTDPTHRIRFVYTPKRASCSIRSSCGSAFWPAVSCNAPASSGVVPMLVETAQTPIVTFDTRSPCEEISYR